MPPQKATVEATDVAELPRLDEAIAGVEQFYETLTGNPPPRTEDESSPIPVEQDAAEFVTDRLDRLIDALGQPVPRSETTWSPPITVWESGQELTVVLELAGVDKRDIKLIDEGECLLVSGQRRASLDGKKLRMTERPLGPFRRKLVLPRGVSAAEASARLHDGMLEIHLPRPVGASGSRPISVT